MRALLTSALLLTGCATRSPERGHDEVVPLYHQGFHCVASGTLQGLRLHPTPPQVRFEALWLDTE